ncbi:hypothetical protein QYF36_020469 [Acer negundo]|nr:hypothetical protein QYF36_020469 [Acer negundo]
MSSQILSFASLRPTTTTTIDSSNTKTTPHHLHNHTLSQRVYIPSHVYKHPAALLLELSTSLDELYRILPLIIKHGLYGEHLFQTKLVSLFCKHGSLIDAARVFEPIEFKLDALYHTMLKGYASNSSLDDALTFFCRMKYDDVPLVVYNFTYLLKVCGDKGELRREGGNPEEAMEFFQKMLDEGVEPTNVTIMEALHACAALGDFERGVFIHKLLDRLKLGTDVSVANSLISMYSKCKKVDIAASVFKNLQNKTRVSWNAMILGYAQNGCINEALNYFCEMRSQNLIPDSFTMVSVIPALAELSVTRHAKCIHALVIRAKAAAKKNGNARRTIATTGMDYIITSSNASNMSILGC